TSSTRTTSRSSPSPTGTRRSATCTRTSTTTSSTSRHCASGPIATRRTASPRPPAAGRATMTEPGGSGVQVAPGDPAQAAIRAYAAAHDDLVLAGAEAVQLVVNVL